MKKEVSKSDYFKADDMRPPQLLQIKTVSLEELGDEKERKWVVWFSNADQGAVLNGERTDQISDIVGTDDSDHWEGFWVVGYRGSTRFGGKSVPCVAFRKPKEHSEPYLANEKLRERVNAALAEQDREEDEVQPEATPAAPKAVPDDDIPF